ncbi:MAG: tRNA (adenosine(37)-N6)-threonylcarbamoyltransferase complex dimerization subunit type 1 TsaB [Clostridia bacterium]|nr:tRNA (adenosine(37)-N6)-threonylcarbamoyltransferase complex dimerization subunit type 1 TsaB [Clostridia bacterium]
MILAVDTSATPVSCALVRDGRVLALNYAHTGLTHSQTLMPMVEHMLRMASVTAEQVDAMAVNAGPGSFTGVRIGVSAVKGLAFAHEKPCISVSTLAAMAENAAVLSGCAICCAMDARCQQVYTALFEKNEAGETVRLTEDEAVSIEELGERLRALHKPILLTGDGSNVCFEQLAGTIPHLYQAPPSARYQNAAATAVLAERLFLANETVSAEALLPVYLRLPQAERELRLRQEQAGE